MDKIVYQLLLKNNIKNISKEELTLQIESHPSYPSLHAITGVLDHFGIDNLALDIPQNEEVYTQLPNYFIAQTKNDNEELVFIEKKKDAILIQEIDGKKEKISKQKFLKQWTGIIVVIDQEESLGLNNVTNTKSVYFIASLLLVSVFGYFIVNNNSLSIFNILHVVLSFIGLYISYLLVKHELGINSKAVEKLCSQSEKTSCDAVLNSKGANLFGFKLNDISFIFFASLAFSWVLFFINKGMFFNTIALISIFTLPMIVYSVYYQAAIVKKWCPLCLATAGILLAQVILTLTTNSFNLIFDLNEFLIIVFSFISITTAYTTIKPLINTKLNFYKTKVAYYKFKRKFSLFNSIYSNNAYLNTDINNLDEIVFGNPNAKTEIVAITNPLCGFCKATHQAIDKLLSTNKNNLKVTIRFNINTANKEDASYKIATALINLYQKDKMEGLEAMHQIYTDGVDVNKWLKTYNDYIKNSQHDILEVEKQWCTNNNINFTPAVYLNNKEYPKEYDLSDLSFFMDELEEHFIFSSSQKETEKQTVITMS